MNFCECYIDINREDTFYVARVYLVFYGIRNQGEEEMRITDIKILHEIKESTKELVETKLKLLIRGEISSANLLKNAYESQFQEEIY